MASKTEKRKESEDPVERMAAAYDSLAAFFNREYRRWRRSYGAMPKDAIGIVLAAMAIFAVDTVMLRRPTAKAIEERLNHFAAQFLRALRDNGMPIIGAHIKFNGLKGLNLKNQQKQ